jgi:hypothetical protein
MDPVPRTHPSAHRKDGTERVPASLEGLPITWGGEDTNGAKGEQQTITLVRPGSPEALGFTIGCITIHGVRICLECGWLYCRIVIKGRF